MIVYCAFLIFGSYLPFFISSRYICLGFRILANIRMVLPNITLFIWAGRWLATISMCRASCWGFCFKFFATRQGIIYPWTMRTLICLCTNNVATSHFLGTFVLVIIACGLKLNYISTSAYLITIKGINLLFRALLFPHSLIFWRPRLDWWTLPSKSGSPLWLLKLKY